MDKFFSLNKDKQDTIINAALACFGKFGYEKASINDIAVAAGISKASVFQYFGSKKQLYSYLLDYSGKIIMGALHHDNFDEKTDLFDRVLLSSFIETKTLEKNPHISQFITSAWAETAEEVSDILSDFKTETSKFKNNLILRKDDILKFKDPNDTETVYNILMFMAEGYAAYCRNNKDVVYSSLTDDFQKMVEAMRRNFYKEEYLL
ncbi:TPA: TetR/AcrR family transcriptional regulator [Clostridioides difficile]|nr:TetR/AcrR family transcriptional regulator [Clostridioides difficile]HEK8908294.1 TetR/AcrR family transcriptional regulator [Clostridioides difficile]